MTVSARTIGRIRVLPQASTSAPSVPAASVSAQAFGEVSARGPAASGRSLLHPGRPFGARVWLGVASIVGLWWIYHSLPD